MRGLAGGVRASVLGVCRWKLATPFTGLEQVFVEVPLLFKTLETFAQVGHRLPNPMQLLGAELKGVTTLRSGEAALNDRAGRSDDDEGENELEDAHYAILAESWRSVGALAGVTQTSWLTRAQHARSGNLPDSA